MGAMCDPVYDITVTCPECGQQETFSDDSPRILDRAFLWFSRHIVWHDHDKKENNEDE